MRCSAHCAVLLLTLCLPVLMALATCPFDYAEPAKQLRLPHRRTDRISCAEMGSRTVAILLGPKASLVYYYGLLMGAHALALLLGVTFGCHGVAATIFVLPQSLWLCVRIHRQELLRDQDEETAKSMMMFSVALALGILTMPDNLSVLPMMVCALVTVVLKVFAD
ncbi:hypothetical protein AK812_SmicGene28129 [Symbiodinium microadriaticum]|uniref:Uncharacterized protein n=1 Tax=Symbiodinium microadriaticum TaxID=2951 RepID=A0A1Q9D5G3_SYMMI|nr:hypothetical protein AK812_SmicGene28129 [Symbiodinium microadriaticum]